MNDLPKYKNIIKDIKEKIKSDIYKSNEKLPSENELAKEYNVSRMTVNKALLDLERDKYIYKIQGSGTYVRERIVSKKFGSAVSFSKDISKTGNIPGSKLLNFKQLLFEDDINLFKKFGLSQKDNIIFFERLRLSNNEPVAISSTYVSQKFIPDFDISVLKNSFYEYLSKRYNITPICKHYEISAILPSNFQKKWLNIDFGALLKVSHYSYTQKGYIFEYNETVYLGDKFNYVTNNEFGINKKINS